MSGARGFTLVEIMIIIIVGIIIAGAALPAAHTFDDQIAIADARIMETDLMFAQARAVATGVDHRVLFDKDNDVYQIESPPGTVLDEPLTKKPWIRDLGGPGETDLINVDFNGGSALVFNGAGTPSAGGSAVIQVGDFQAVIDVDAVTGVVALTLP